MTTRRSVTLGACVAAALTSTVLSAPALAAGQEQVRIHDIQGTNQQFHS